MLIKEAAERTYAIDRHLAALLSAIAGAANAAGFHTTGFFSANQTGNASAMSDHLEFADLTLAPR